MNLNKNLITITSPSPSNGKSTVATKLAQGYAKIGKKVLLVDNDLKGEALLRLLTSIVFQRKLLIQSMKKR